MAPRNTSTKSAQAYRRNSIDDVLAKLRVLVHEPAPPGADPEIPLARREAVRLMLKRLRGESEIPSKGISAYHKRIYRQLTRADKYGARERPRPWLLDYAARLRAALAYGNSILAWRRRNCDPEYAIMCEGQLCVLEEEMEDARPALATGRLTR